MKTDTPLVSVCILAYNRPEGLVNTISRICSQTYQQLEIIISDDCSPDLTVKQIATEACQKDDRISYYRQEKNLGIIGNHAFLLSKAQGKYIMWACDDDWWHHEFITSCVNQLEQFPQAVLCTTNSTMVANQRFIPLSEYVDTLNDISQKSRFKKVLQAILWSNHAFYGLMRASIAKEVAFKNRLGFDLFFIATLALKGSFIQLPQFYFRKTLGGSGHTIQGNLTAIQVKNRFSKWFPGLTFSLQLFKDCLASSEFNLKDSFEVYKIARSKAPFPEEKVSLLAWLLHIPTQIHNRINYHRSKKKTGDHVLSMKLFELEIPPEEAIYDPENQQLTLPLLNITLEFPRQLDLLKGYHEYLEIMYQHNLTFEQQSSHSIKAKFYALNFYLTSSNSFHIFKEVFIKHCYNIHISSPTVVFDIGMNVGFTSLYFSSMDAVKKVYGFELFPYTAQLAQDNFSLNPQLLEKIEIFPFGLSDEDTDKKLPFSKQYNAMNGEKGIDLSFYQLGYTDLEECPVAFRSASAVLQPLVTQYSTLEKILKIDVEGGEQAILNDLSASGLLAKFNGILLEWHQVGAKQIEVQLSKLGYRVISIRDHHPSLAFDTGMIYAVKD